MRKYLLLILLTAMLLPNVVFGAVANNLVSCWELDEESGTRVDAVLSSGNDLTDNNTVLFGTGKIGNAADFEFDTTEYLSISDGSQTGLDLGAGDFSFSVWIKLESDTSGGQDILAKRDGSAVAGYHWRINSPALTVSLHTRSGSSGETETADTAVTTGSFFHLVVTRAASDGAVVFYLNGSSDGSGNTSRNVDTTGQFTVGRNGDNNDAHFDGLIDIAAVWNKVLTASEVAELYNSGNAISCATIITEEGGQNTQGFIIGFLHRIIDLFSSFIFV